jgi:hypothetical protein
VRDHAAGHGLGEEEDRPVQLKVGVVGGAVVVQERLEDEQAHRVDQQGGVGVLLGQLPAHPFGLLTIGQVGGDAIGLAVLGQCLDGVVDLAGVLSDDDGAAAGGHDVGGGLASHPAAAADDHQFLPGEDGHGLRPVGARPRDRAGPGASSDSRSFQSFLSAGWQPQLNRIVGWTAFESPMASHDG